MCTLQLSTTALPTRTAPALRSRAIAFAPANACRSSLQQRRSVLAAAAAEKQRASAQAQLAGLVAGSVALPAAADEAVSEAVAAAQEAAANDPTTLVMGALFTVAIAALTVVTLGVAYLSYTSWSDSRAEQEDRRRAEAFRPVPSGNGAGPSKKAAAKKAAAAEKQAEEFKGFGARK